MTDDAAFRPRSEPSSGARSTNRYRARWHRMLRSVAQRVLLRGVISAVTTTTVDGLENTKGLPKPVVLVANHCSHLDTAVLISRLPYRIAGFLAVGAAADHFYTRWWVKAATCLFFNTYPIHRSGAHGHGGGISQRLLRQGVPLLLFPEGTRSRNGHMGSFTPGVARLMVSAKATCLPVGLIGTFEAMPPGRSWPVWGRPPIRVLVGAPMESYPQETPEEFNDRIVRRIRQMLEAQSPRVEEEPAPLQWRRPGEEAA